MCTFADKGRDWLRPHAGNHFIARDTPVAAAAAREMKPPLRERERWARFLATEIFGRLAIQTSVVFCICTFLCVFCTEIRTFKMQCIKYFFRFSFSFLKREFIHFIHKLWEHHGEIKYIFSNFKCPLSVMRGWHKKKEALLWMFWVERICL